MGVHISDSSGGRLKRKSGVSEVDNKNAELTHRRDSGEATNTSGKELTRSEARTATSLTAGAQESETTTTSPSSTVQVPQTAHLIQARTNTGRTSCQVGSPCRDHTGQTP